MDHPRITPPFTVNVPVGATNFAIGTLEEVAEYLRRFADTNDGENGAPEPNAAAYLLNEVETAIDRLERETPTPAAGPEESGLAAGTHPPAEQQPREEP